MVCYSVQQVATDPPRFAVIDPDGNRITRPVPSESKPTYEALADFANEIRRKALEERQ